MDPTARQSIIDRINQATNVLVTVKNSPNIDQLAGCIGLTLFLNHISKHGTAVFSGAIPSTIEFLKPEETIEKTTDSLRDFIIALDKTKADKLRYKVENDVVKIFITPYRTSLTEKDFDFSQGDFNVDVVIALGVHAKEDLDEALVQHGRILHDATVISLNNGPGGNVGTLHLEDPNASSLCEMLLGICEGLQPNSVDTQMATAFLTGIVAETERFSNPKTTPQAMSLAAKLMAAGANQQLIATQLQSGGAIATSGKKGSKKTEEDEAGTLTIEHDEAETQPAETSIELPEIATPTTETPDEKSAEAKSAEPKDKSDDQVAASAASDSSASAAPTSPIKDVRPLSDSDGINALPTPPPAPANSFPLEPPTRGGTLTANTQPQPYDPSTDPLSQPQAANPSLGKTNTLSSAPVIDSETISSIEQDVSSPHAQATPTEGLDEARKAVEAAANAAPAPLETPQATGAQYLDPAVQASANDPVVSTSAASETSTAPQIPPDLAPSAPLAPTYPVVDANNSPLLDPNPTLKMTDDTLPAEQTSPSTTQLAPPPVPPPMLPPTPPAQ